MRLKTIILSLLLMFSILGFSQDSSKALLMGKWELVKMLNIDEKDTSNQTRDYPSYIEFNSSGDFQQITPEENSVIEGRYIKSIENTLQFKKLIMTVSYPWAKTKTPDLVLNITSPDLKVFKLTKKELVLVNEYSEMSEGKGDNYYYYIKVK